MPSLKFPDTGTRMAVLRSGRPAAKARAYVYTDQACTTVADAYADNGGQPGGSLPVDSSGRRYLILNEHGEQPDWWGPTDGTATLWLSVNGVTSRVDADYGRRFAALGAAAVRDVGVEAGTVAAGNDARLLFAGVPATGFGFVGNGLADNTAAFIALVNHANSVGGNIDILFPPGTYNIGAAAGVPDITVPNVRFKGAHTDLTTLRLTGGTYFKLNGGSGVVRGFTLSDMTIRYNVPDTTSPTVRSLGFTGHVVERVRYYNGGTFIQMGSSTVMSYSLKMRHVSVVLANVGKPFVNLVNGAGLTWDTFDGIYHIQSTAPVFDRASTMNTVPGTNVVDITGNWDSVELSVFAEKMYRVVSIDGPPGTVVFNVRVKNSVCDYIRDCVVYADMKSTPSSSLNTVSIDNVYGATWEGHAFYFRSDTSDVRNVTFNNVYTPFTGKSAVFFDAVNSGARKFMFTGCRFLGVSRMDDTSHAVDIGLATNLTMLNNRIGGSDTSGNIPWGGDKGLKLRNPFNEGAIIGNVADAYDIPYASSAVSANASKQVRVTNNAFRGTVAAPNYAGIRTGAPFTKPASGVDWYNVTPFSLDVIVGGNSITAVKLDGTILPITQGTLCVEPGHYYSITYSDGANANVVYHVRQ
ncbi:hypothetical protein ACIODS_12190 [Micromonospora chalcea]|uniref:hypothetical protein n=1 Tax=Micromonospora chalcea TaxID=1874 RepID=UPI0038202333